MQSWGEHRAVDDIVDVDGQRAGPPGAEPEPRRHHRRDPAADGHLNGAGGGIWGTISGLIPNQTDLNNALGLKAPLASPVFTGQPTIPDFTLAGHAHLNAASGGTLDAAAIATGLFAIGRIPTGTTSSTVALGNHLHAGVYEPVITAGLVSQVWLGTKAWGTLDTSITPENGNLYFTTARGRAAIAAPAAPLAYNSGTGVFSLPAAASGQAGYLTAADWAAFTAKQAALGFTPLNTASNLSDLASASTARTSLGLGGAAVLSVGTTTGTVAAGDDVRFTTAYTASFTAQTTVTIAGATHGLGSANLTVQCFDAGTPSQVVEADTITVAPGSFDVVVSFVIPQDGKCVVRR